MQQTVILALATMLAIVAAVFAVLLWRFYRRAALRRRLRAAGLRGWASVSALPGDAAAAQPMRPDTAPAPAAPPPSPSSLPSPLSIGGDEWPGHTLRAAVHGAGIATAAPLHH